MIKYKIDVKKINKDLLFEGDKSTYLFGAIFENKDGTNEYGNDGYIVQDVSKEDREAGKRGPIIGNWKYFQKVKEQKGTVPAAKPSAKEKKKPDDLPF